jgi:hypothetical protein
MTNKEKLGQLGEHLFIHVFGGKLSENKYDTSRDLILDGKDIEVKTQNRHPTQDTFAVSSSKHLQNVLKCMVVDRLIFIEYGHTDEIKIWEVVDRKSYMIYTTRPTTYYPQGLTMVGFPISKMKLLHTYIDGHLANQMRDLSSSTQFNDRKPEYLKPDYL